MYSVLRYKSQIWILNHPVTPLRAYFLTPKGTREKNCLGNTAIYQVNKCWTKDGAVSTLAKLRDG